MNFENGEGHNWDNKVRCYCPTSGGEGVTGGRTGENWDNKTVGYCPSFQGRGRGRRRVLNICLVAGLIVCALGAWLALQFWGSAAAADASALVAVVHTENGVAAQLPLDADATETVETEYGTNVVCVSAGQVFVQEADCPGHDCMQQGRIETPGQTLVCLPHKLWVEVASAADAADATQEETTFDTVAS